MSALKRFKVRGLVLDVAAFLALEPRRRASLRRLAAFSPEADYIRVLADALHPERQRLVVDSFRDESPNSRSFRLVPDKEGGTGALAYFRAGQYLGISCDIGDAWISRPYSISSAPYEALAGYYEITLKRTEGGLMTSHAWDSWKPGAKLEATGPMGFMSHEVLRDSRHIVGIAGGCGVTPFRSIAREIVAGRLDATLSLVYGCADEADIQFGPEFEGYFRKSPDRFRLTYVFSSVKPRDALQAEARGIPCERGFVTAETLRRACDPADSSFFLCGPAVMYSFVSAELAKLGVPRRRIRREAFGEVKDPAAFPGYPRAASLRDYRVVAMRGDEAAVFDASGSESLLVSLERARLAPPSSCRSGECQVCRARLVEGSVWTSPESDGRRAADKAAGYIHPCSAFPLSDLKIELPPLAGSRK